MVTTTPRVVVSASIAFDHIMLFDGSFKDHILVDKTDSLALSFLVQSHSLHRGGVAGNMSYSFGLLGVPNALVGTVGREFGPYAEVLEGLGVDLSLVRVIEDEFTSTSFMNSDKHGSQIAAFHPGAGGHSADLDVTALARSADYGIVSAGAPDAMVKHAEEIAAAGCKLVFDPAFQIVILSAEQLARGIDLADTVMGNEYEFAMLEQKTGMTIDDIARSTPLVIRTHSEHGAELRAGGDVVRTPAAPAEPFVDPWGGGDAYRAGAVAGLLLGKDLDVVGRLGSLVATYAIEQKGPQDHQFSLEAFHERFCAVFPDYRDAVTLEDMRSATTVGAS